MAVAEAIGVCADPEVEVVELQLQHQFLVLASDGVFEFMSNDDVVQLVGRSTLISSIVFAGPLMLQGCCGVQDVGFLALCASYELLGNACSSPSGASSASLSGALPVGQDGQLSGRPRGGGVPGG